MKKSTRDSLILFLVISLSAVLVMVPSNVYWYSVGTEKALALGIRQGRESQVSKDCQALGHKSGKLIEYEHYSGDGLTAVCTDEQEMRKNDPVISSSVWPIVDGVVPLASSATPAGSTTTVCPSICSDQVPNNDIVSRWTDGSGKVYENCLSKDATRWIPCAPGVKHEKK